MTTPLIRKPNCSMSLYRDPEMEKILQEQYACVKIEHKVDNINNDKAKMFLDPEIACLPDNELVFLADSFEVAEQATKSQLTDGLFCIHYCSTALYRLADDVTAYADMIRKKGICAES